MPHAKGTELAHACPRPAAPGPRCVAARPRPRRPHWPSPSATTAAAPTPSSPRPRRHRLRHHPGRHERDGRLPEGRPGDRNQLHAGAEQRRPPACGRSPPGTRPAPRASPPRPPARRSPVPTAPPTVAGRSAGRIERHRGDAACGGAQAGVRPGRLRPLVGGPSGVGSDLTYIPFGQDALSFGYYRNTRRPGDNLTCAQLTSCSRPAADRQRRDHRALRDPDGLRHLPVLEHGLSVRPPAQMAPPTVACTPVGTGSRRTTATRLKARLATRCARRRAVHHRVLGRQLHLPVQRRGRSPAPAPDGHGRPRRHRRLGDPYDGVAPALTAELRASTPAPPTAATSTTSCPPRSSPGSATTT